VGRWSLDIRNKYEYMLFEHHSRAVVYFV
jgi:hypothetical protein